MTVDALVEQLAQGELSADEFNRRLQEETQVAAEAAAAAAAAKEAGATEAAAKEAAAAEAAAREAQGREPARVSSSESAELSPDRQRELDESKARIKRAADKARHI